MLAKLMFSQGAGPQPLAGKQVGAVQLRISDLRPAGRDPPLTHGSRLVHRIGDLRTFVPIPYAARPGYGTWPSRRQALEATTQRGRPAVIAAARGCAGSPVRPSLRSSASSITPPSQRDPARPPG